MSDERRPTPEFLATLAVVASLVATTLAAAFGRDALRYRSSWCDTRSATDWTYVATIPPVVLVFAASYAFAARPSRRAARVAWTATATASLAWAAVLVLAW